MTHELRESFKNPPREFRGAPFWSWNGKLDPKELRRQVRDMKAHGMGGFFMHSRAGLETPYLGPEWMEAVRACVDEAKKVGMDAWLYDEDRWPSGAAGGLLTEDHPEYWAKSLRLRRIPAADYAPDAHTLFAWSAKVDGCTASDLKPLAPDAPSASKGKGREALLFSVVSAKTSGWYNGGAYPDLMDRGVTEKFLDVTLAPYEREVKKEFGKTVPGIFTDEPKYFEGGRSGETLPWTPRLGEVFRERYGYDLIERLPELFFEVAGADSHALRRDYYDCITHLFAQSFTKTYAERAGALGLDLTGHYLEEQTLASQTRVIGAAMRHYEHMPAPGIDILRESISEVLTVKQCSSVARQFGRERVLSETYGASGWGFTLEGEKWVGDWQIALGVNLRCQHLAWYTMARSGKRDYPPCFGYQSSSWSHHEATEDYFARACLMTTRGEAEREVLVLHPIESYWSECAALAPEKPDLRDLDEKLVTVMSALLESHHDFDLGDEDILARHASVEAKSLRVGKARYHAIVVPPAVTWRRSTVDLLERFADAGGKVVVVSPVAERVDCEKGRRFAEIHSREDVLTVECGKAEIAEALEAARVRTVSVADAGGDEIASVVVQRRSHEGRTILFVVNTDRKKGCVADVALSRTTGGVEDWDLRTGEVRSVASRELDGWVYTMIDLPPTGSKMLVIGPGLDTTVPGAARLKDTGKVRLGRTWEHERAEPNARILDKCRWRLDDGALSEEVPVWVVDDEVRRMVGLPSTASSETQLWKIYRDEMHDTGRVLELRFGVKARVKPGGAVWLAMERPGDFEIEVNGSPLKAKPKGWWVDRAFEKLDIKDKLKKGANEIVLRTSFRTDTGVEQMYLVGDFGVDAKSLDLVAEPKALKTGSIVKQGYAQYSGSMLYRQSVRLTRRKDERLFLSFGNKRPAAKCVAVRVNGRDAGLIPWPPMEVEITDLARSGANDIEIEAVISRRNVFGPLHLAGADPARVGPGEFVPKGERYRPEYSLVPAGITGDVTVVRRLEVDR